MIREAAGSCGREFSWRGIRAITCAGECTQDLAPGPAPAAGRQRRRLLRRSGRHVGHVGHPPDREPVPLRHRPRRNPARGRRPLSRRRRRHRAGEAGAAPGVLLPAQHLGRWNPGGAPAAGRRGQGCAQDTHAPGRPGRRDRRPRPHQSRRTGKGSKPGPLAGLGGRLRPSLVLVVTTAVTLDRPERVAPPVQRVGVSVAPETAEPTRRFVWFGGNRQRVRSGD